MVREPYSGITNPNRLLWQQCVQNAAGIDTQFDTMVRHPQIHLREVYAKTRKLVEQHTKRGFDEYVLAGGNAFPQQFCEYNTLGAVAINFFSDRYTFVDYDRPKDARECRVDPKDGWQYIYRPGRDKVAEFWSHGTISRYRLNAEAFLRGNLPTYLIK